jgi:hypothetical protein
MTAPRPGASPEKPWGVRPYQVAGQVFPSLQALSAAVAARRLAHHHDVEYYDAFLAEVINELHPDVLARGYTATAFCERSWPYQSARVRAQLQGGTCFEAFFRELGRWQDVTTYPWRRPGPVPELKQALRTKFAILIRPAARPEDACAVCGATAFLEYDHVAPTFDEIVAECLARMSAHEIATRFGYDKFAADTISLADFVPDAHPAVRHLVDRHRDNHWQWLCVPHHRAKTVASRGAERRTA